VDAFKYHWFANRDFRRAVSMAIDRDALIRGPFYGYGLKNWSSPTIASKQWGSHGIVGVDYDPAGARQILDRLGMKDRDGDGIREDEHGHPIRFTIKTNADNVMRIQMLSLIKDDLAKVGVACVPAPVEFNTMNTNFRQDFQYEAALGGLGTAVPPDPGMYANFITSRGLLHYWDVKQDHPATAAESQLDHLYAQVVAST